MTQPRRAEASKGPAATLHRLWALRALRLLVLPSCFQFRATPRTLTSVGLGHSTVVLCWGVFTPHKEQKLPASLPGVQGF